MSGKNTAYSDEDILTKLNAKVKQAVTWRDSKLSQEYTRVIKHKNSELPRRQHDGGSAYVSTDVYDSHEMIKAQLLETFASGYQSLVTFDALNEQDTEAARIATAYTNHVVFQQNPGYEICEDVITDGLDARLGVAKVFWETIEEFEEETFDTLPLSDVHGLAAQEDVDSLDADLEDPALPPEQHTYTGTLKRKKDKSKVTIESVAPEEFLVESRARSLAKSKLTSHRSLKTRAELYEMKFDRKKVDAIAYGDEKSVETGPEMLARHGPTAATGLGDDAIQPEMEQVTLYDTYVRMVCDKDRGACLYHIIHADTQIFLKEEVSSLPFFVWAPLPVSHAIYGNNFGARIIPTQNARTTLTRSILDHAAITTNPRWQVVQGGLLNPKEMLDNRLGGLVNVKREGSVLPLPQANLNPYVFETIKELKERREETTGISSLSQGLNKDAISSQNSQGMVEGLVSLSQQRQKIMARGFAIRWLIPLYIEVYRLVLENETKEKIIEVTGNFVKCDPKTWPERLTMTPSLHLGYGERDKLVGKYQALYKELAEDPQASYLFTAKNRYKLKTDAMKTAGFMNTHDYITDPEKVEAPPPISPKDQAELDIKKIVAEAAKLQAQSAAQKTERLTEFDAMKIELAKMAQQLKEVVATRSEHRKDVETGHKIATADREMTLLEDAAVNNPEAERAIISPNA